MNVKQVAVLTQVIVVALQANFVFPAPRNGHSGGRHKDHNPHTSSSHDSKTDSGLTSSSTSPESFAQKKGLSHKRMRAKKMRMLQRLLRHLSPEEMADLVRGGGTMTKDKREKDSDFNNLFGDPTNPTYMGVFHDDPYVQVDREVPKQINCPPVGDGIKRFACPTPDRLGVYKCIDDHALCDSKPHCPGGEDEDRTVCMFHKMTMNYFKVLMDAVFGLSRSTV